MMLFVSVVCSLIYGVVAGTFSGGTQLWAAPVKIAAGLMISALICLPSLYIFTCLSGSQARLVEVCGLLAGLLMLMTILLDRLRAGGVDFFAIHRIARLDGHAAPGFLVHRDLFGLRFLEAGFSHSQRPVAGRLVHLGHHLSARRGANDHRAAAHPRHGGHLFADGEKILRGPLGRLFEGAGWRI